MRRSNSVLFREHDSEHALGHGRIGRVGRVLGKGGIKIIDLEKDRVPLRLERAKVMLAIRVVGAQKSSNTAIVLMMRATAPSPNATTPGVITARPPIKFWRS